MPFDTLTFVLNSFAARNSGITDQRANQLALLGAVLPIGLVPSVLITQAIARNEAETSTPPVTPPGTPTGTPPTSLQVQVPDVKSKNFATAQALLLSFGLQVSRQDVISATTPKDVVIDQNPAAGTTVAAGTSVTLSVSLGVMVPDVRNLPVDDAVAQLQAIGLQTQRVDQLSSAVQQGLVISQDPLPPATVSPGTSVTLTVSLGANVTVPNVVDKLSTDAQTQLQSAGLQAKLTSQPSDAIRKGFVIKQDPAAGTSVPFGTVVTLTVSTGQDFPVPDVTGLSFDEAEQKLQSLKLQVQRVDQTNDAVAEGFVISQDPAAGTQVSPNSQVTLFVSKGTTVDLPDLRGKPFTEARETLQDLDFGVKRVDVDNDKPEGTVVDQEPEAGKVAPETQVTLFVSKGPQGPG